VLCDPEREPLPPRDPRLPDFGFGRVDGRWVDGGLDCEGVLEVVGALGADELVVVVVVVEVVVEVSEQTCEMPRIFKPGGTSDEIAVPSGTLNTRPPTTSTRRTQAEAPTAGDHRPNPPTVSPAASSPATRF
jgi:hypothetical protein